MSLYEQGIFAAEELRALQEQQKTSKSNRSTRSGKQEQLWTPMFIGVIVCTLFSFLVGQGSNAGTSVYLESMGLPLGLAGIGALWFCIAAAATRILCGSLVDNRGRMIAARLGGALLLIGCVGPLFVNDGIPFVIWRIFQGMGFSIETTALATAAADVVPESRLGEGISYYGLGQAISMAVGPGIAIVLASSSEPRNFYYGIAAFAAIALVISFFLNYERFPLRLPETSSYRKRYESGRIGIKAVEETEEQEEESRKLGLIGRLLDLVFEPGALPAAIVMSFLCAAFGFNIFYVGTFGNAINISNPGMYFTCAAVVMIIVRICSGRLMNSGSPVRVMAISVACGLVTFSIFLLCSLGVVTGTAADILFYVSGLFYGVFMGLAVPINSAMAVKMSPDTRWGAANALVLLFVDLSNAVFSTLWGFLSGIVGYTVIIVAIMIFIIVALFVSKIVYSNYNRN